MSGLPFSARLRYVDAAEVAEQPVKFNHLDVRSASGEKLGDVDGFIFDTTSGLLYYLVVDSGGWFKSRRYLLPVGHVQLDQNSDALRVDVELDKLRKYPEFDRERFQTLSDEDLQEFERQTVAACCPDDGPGDNPLVWGYERWRHYRQPEWWKGAGGRATQAV